VRRPKDVLVSDQDKACAVYVCCRWGFWKKLAGSSKDQQHLLPDGHSPSSPTSQHTLVIQVIQG
jgi:hypothetical protein